MLQCLRHYLHWRKPLCHAPFSKFVDREVKNETLDFTSLTYPPLHHLFMGLFDTLLQTIGGCQPGATNPLVGTISKMISQQGGLQGMRNRFSENGLGDVFSSWVGPGENQSISAAQLQQIIDSEQLAALSRTIGIGPAQIAAMLSQYLPKIVDKLTPTGQIETNLDLEGRLTALLKDGIGKLLS